MMHDQGMFSVSPPLDTKPLEMLFGHNVPHMLLKRVKCILRLRRRGYLIYLRL